MLTLNCHTFDNLASRLAVLQTNMQDHITTYSPPPEETAKVLQKMVMDTANTVAEACRRFHQHPAERCRVVFLPGFYTCKDHSIGHRRMETMNTVNNALERMAHPHLVIESLAPLMEDDILKLFPVTTKDPGPALRRGLKQKLHAALTLASP